MDKHQRLQEWTARIEDLKTSGLTIAVLSAVRFSSQPAAAIR